MEWAICRIFVRSLIPKMFVMIVPMLSSNAIGQYLSSSAKYFISSALLPKPEIFWSNFIEISEDNLTYLYFTTQIKAYLSLKI